MDEHLGSMEHTFITIHNLSPEANILFASDSITEILGFQPEEVLGRSCFEYFHPDEVPFARTVHSREVRLDKAASLHYVKVQTRDGQWTSCECCFTTVHDVLVACTSIYRRGAKSERRAIEAPQIRRIFSSSPRDPRYHMLEHLSPKFKMPLVEREPRAALILNRFTRPLSIMYATDSIAQILGLGSAQVTGKSFYECIADNCLADAVRCLESAKSNDSIAYLRFWFRDPRTLADFDGVQHGNIDDQDGRDSPSSSDSDGGAQLEPMEIDSDTVVKDEPASPSQTHQSVNGEPSRMESAPSTIAEHSSPQPFRTRHSPSPMLVNRERENAAMRHIEPLATFELEAVVSCTSDGLVVVLRRARPPIPELQPTLLPVQSQNGLFAAPWGEHPVQPQYSPELYHHFRAPLLPEYMPVQEHVKAAGGPPNDQLMRSIRDVAVFAWALVGINGNIAAYGQGTPLGEAQPHGGLPIWDINGGVTDYLGPENQALRRWSQFQFGDPTGKGEMPATDFVPHYESPMGNYNTAYDTHPVWNKANSYTQAEQRQSDHQPRYSNLKMSAYHDQQAQGPWAEIGTSIGRRQYDGSATTPPTTQGPGAGENQQQYRWS